LRRRPCKPPQRSSVAAATYMLPNACHRKLWLRRYAYVLPQCRCCSARRLAPKHKNIASVPVQCSRGIVARPVQQHRLLAGKEKGKGVRWTRSSHSHETPSGSRSGSPCLAICKRMP
jgi:hypothetical protein